MSAASYSVTPLGQTRWFWAVWLGTWLPRYDQAPTAHGYADTEAGARAAAREIAGPRAVPQTSSDARHAHHRMTEDVPAFARCKSGDAWFWCAWASWRALFDGAAPITEGRAATVEAAEAAGWAAVGPAGGALWAGCAQQVLRERACQHRAARRSRTTRTNQIEWLYSEYGGHKWRVTRSTKRRVYINVSERERYGGMETPRPPGEEWRAYDDFHEAYVDRHALEQTGRAKCRSRVYDAYGWLYRQPPAQAEEVPACLVALGLPASADARAVKRAFRRLSRVAHPDAGGSDAAFIDLQAACETALRLVTTTPAGAGDRRP